MKRPKKSDSLAADKSDLHLAPDRYRRKMNMLKWILTLFLIMQALPSFALTPLLKITDGGTVKDEQLTMTKIEVDVRVHDMLSETKVTMTFGNHLNRTIAADLYFPLPEGSVVSGYALDINGVMVDGVAVEREKARVVFEQEVRKGIDPGIIEKVAGNNYKTRIFPIPAKGSRTIMVRYVSRLTTSGSDAIYVLPLHFSRPVAELALRVEVVKPAAAPEVRKSDLANFSFKKWRESFVAETRLQNVAPQEDLRIALPDISRGKQSLEKASDGVSYFIISDPPGKVIPAAPLKIKKVSVLWDGSGSMGEVAHEREFNLLKKFFAIYQNVEVDLTVFRNSAEKPQRIKIKNGDAEPLIKILSSVIYDGGTQLGSLNNLPAGFKPDIYLLFSDGLGNFGVDFKAKLAAPLYAASSDPRSNHGLLRLISGESGGSYLNLAAMTDEDAVSAIGSPVLRLMQVKSVPGEVEMVYPLAGSEVAAGTFSVTGRLLAKQANITLVYGVNGREVARKSYRLTAGEAVEGELLETFWAVQRLDALSILPRNNHEEIIATAKRFGLTTPDTSLIVLENLSQYVEYRIIPPASLPVMRKQYVERTESKEKEKQAARQSKIDMVANLWSRRVAWWEKEFTVPKDFRYNPVSNKSGASTERPSSPIVGSPTPSPPALSRSESVNRELASDSANGAGRSTAIAEEERSALPLSERKKSKVSSRNGAGEPESGAQIAIKAWDPDTPYIKLLKDTNPGDRYKVYIEQKKSYGRSPGFYFDCAEFFLTNGNREIAIRIISNLSELELENPALLRVLAHRLSQIDELDLAVGLFEQVLKLRPEEAQSHRDLALVLARRGNRDISLSSAERKRQVKADYDRGIELLYNVVKNEWKRTDEIELVALMELNRLIPVANSLGVKLPPIDKRLVKALDVDLRIVLTWDMDMTDLDLWVTEPSGEKAIYSHPDTATGGHLSHDVTGGYGPEEYNLRRGMSGEYKIDANYYGNRNPGLAGIATLQVEVFTNFGRRNEKRQVITKRLDNVSEVVLIGSAFLGQK